MHLNQRLTIPVQKIQGGKYLRTVFIYLNRKFNELNALVRQEGPNKSHISIITYCYYFHLWHVLGLFSFDENEKQEVT